MDVRKIDVISRCVKPCEDFDAPLALAENEELLTYAEDVLTRFVNPYIKHYFSSIALNSVSKFKVRVLPSITEYIMRLIRWMTI